MGNASLGQRRDFRNLLDKIEGVALWTATAPGEFDYISAGFEDIWGIPPSAVENDVDRLLETIHPDDRERVRENIRASAQDPRDREYEARIIRPDGTVRWVLTQHVVLGGDDGDIAEIVGVCTDITEQKRREQELELLNQIVRHDIRNDMTAVVGWAELLEDHVDDDGQEYLENVLASSNHILESTEIAKEYADIVSSTDEPTVEPVALRPVLTTVVSLREETYPEAEFKLDGSPPDVEVMANGMLSAVFRNLLNNAVQHNDTETPIVDIACERRGDAVVVRIADNGPGVPDEQKDVVFGKGERGLGSPGTGLGLYLVETLVSQYGGSVWVEDNEPTGSVFAVRLPRAGSR